MKVNKNENGRSMIEMLEKVKQPLNAVLRRQAQVFRCCQSAFASRSNTENQVTEAPLGARQRQCALAQSGRSMIEMLGVLAIIGVLSVGGIAGYSKAMTKYRINKTIEQISMTITNIRTLFATQKGGVDDEYGDPFGKYHSLSNNVLLKAKLVPDELWNSNKTAMENAFGGRFKISADYYEMSEDSFYIKLDKIPTDACIELATQNWPEEVFMVAAGGNLSYIVQDCINFPSELNYYSDDPEFSCTQGCRRDGGLPISIDKAAIACSCGNNCSIFIGAR